MITKTPIITQHEYNYLLDRLEHLKKAEKFALSDVKQALKYGSETWHDNDMFDTAKLKQQTVDRELKQIKHTLKNARVVSQASTDYIQIGTAVKLQNENNNEFLNLKIGGDCTSLLGSEWVSLESPIGMAIAGKKNGDKIEVKTPNGSMFYKVCDISLV